MWIGSQLTDPEAWEVAAAYLVVGSYNADGIYECTYDPRIIKSYTDIDGLADYLAKWGHKYQFDVLKGQTAEIRIIFEDLRLEDTEYSLVTHDFQSQDVNQWYGYQLDSPVVVDSIKDGLPYPYFYDRARQAKNLSFDEFLEKYVKVKDSPLIYKGLGEVRRVTPM